MQSLTPETNLSDFLRINPLQQEGLKKIHTLTIENLLRYFPVRYEDIADTRSISQIAKGEKVTLFGKITDLKLEKSFKKKINMARGRLNDGEDSIGLIWFNQPYIAKMIQNDAMVKVEGIVSEKNNQFYISNPAITNISYTPPFSSSSLFNEKQGTSLSIYPVYPETRNITSRWIHHALEKIFKSDFFDRCDDPLPKEILNRYNLPSLKTSYIWIHTPKNKNDAEAARKRFAFEEVFFIQLQKQKEKKLLETLPSAKIVFDQKSLDSFLSRFPFALTEGQRKAIGDILSDFQKGFPMGRLLEGDVGSGKTAVAATTAYIVTNNEPLSRPVASDRSFLKEKDLAENEKKSFGNFQVATMAPTEILAAQHFESFITYFKHLPISIALITGSACKKFPSKVDPSGTTAVSKPQLLKWVANGEISILIGTHALIQKKVKFKNLAYVIIDEQHRFGTKQRKELARKDGLVPHLLSMTATPIPRTLALTIYGDLDLSILDEMPKGRKPIMTEIVPTKNRDAVYEKIKKELVAGRQMYVICPRINEPDPDKEKAILAKSVMEEAERLKRDVFQKYKIGVVHSKLLPKDKEKVMADFGDGKIDILVSTSVVEVGVNVPNATVIIIEGAERFGLAQLHQLRGRVLRSSHQAYCYIFAETKSDKTVDRMRAFLSAKNGFELAELDLKLRGIGELGGGKQWGVSDIAMIALQNLKMVEAARTEARNIVESDSELQNHPVLRMVLETKSKYHFE